jgi:hypothetical protein
MGIGLFGGDEDEFTPPKDSWADGVCRPFSDDTDFGISQKLTCGKYKIVNVEVLAYIQL